VFTREAAAEVMPLLKESKRAVAEFQALAAVLDEGYQNGALLKVVTTLLKCSQASKIIIIIIIIMIIIIIIIIIVTTTSKSIP
jgi:t-SNARE complex subunit (syntaxin)